MSVFIDSLTCLRCGKKHPPTKGLYVCHRCGGKLEVLYNYDAIAAHVDKRVLAKRPAGVWKYKEFLPVVNEKSVVTLGEGGTPLLEARKLARGLGVKHLWLKDETRNPTASFKDRPMSVGISKAVEFGAKVVVTASSGNAAVALAAYAAKAGIECYAFVPAKISVDKLAQLLIYGAHAVKAKPRGVGDPCYELMRRAWKRYGWHPIPSAGAFNPYHWEGAKTMSYEICEQLGWRVPDWVIVPTGAGTLLSGNAKGYSEFERLGLVKGIPRLAAIQAEGCAPLVDAFEKGISPDKISTWRNPRTVAGGLVDPYPWDADTAIPALERSHGAAVAVSDSEILQAEKLLAKSEGIFAEPSGAAGLAGLSKLLETKVIDRSDVIVVEVTGGGLKDVKTAMKLAEGPKVIEPQIEQLRRFLESGVKSI